jgi:cytoskeletal protein CcmA (bactofilin family)
MFSSKSKDNKSGSAMAGLPAGNEKEGTLTTVIAKGTRIEGKFVCAENVRLDGEIHGEVQVDKRFVMGDTSYVKGNITARDASIKGRIKGDIIVKEALHLLDTAVIEGNIVAKTMVVDEGARYNGTCRIGETAASHAAHQQNKAQQSSNKD